MRRLLYVLLGLLLSLPILGSLGLLVIKHHLQQAGIANIQVHNIKLSWQRLSVQQLSFQLTSPVQQVKMQQLELSWRWQGAKLPEWQHLSIDQTELLLTRSLPMTTAEEATVFSLPTTWTLPNWLPQQLNLPHILISWPCIQRLCQLQASSKMLHNAHESSYLELGLNHPALPEPLLAALYWYVEPETSRLEGSLKLTDVLALSVKQRFDNNFNAQTDIALALSPLPDYLDPVLEALPWQLPIVWREQFTQPIQVFLHANWQLPTAVTPNKLKLSDFPSMGAALTLRAASPFITPWGWLAGETALSFQLQQGQLTAWQANGELQLSHYLPSTLAATLPISNDPLLLTIRTEQQHDISHIPLYLNARSTGALKLELTAELLLALQQDLTVQLQQGHLTLATNELQLAGGLKLARPQLSLELSGSWQPSAWQLTTPNAWQLSTQLKSDNIDTELKLQGTTSLSVSAATPIQIDSQLQLVLEQLKLVGLVTQDWQSDLTLQGTAEQMLLASQWRNADNLTLQLDGELTALSSLQLNWQLADIFFLAGNPLPELLDSWPSLLSMQRGRLLAQGKLFWRPTFWQLLTQLEFRELAGLFDRTLFSGLNSQLTLDLTPDQLVVSIPSLRLEQLNHGFTFGPLEAQLRYQAPLRSMHQGQLDLQQFQSAFLLGKIRLAAQRFNLTEPQQDVIVYLEQLDLNELLQQHPSSAVQAQGKLSGQIPLRWAEQQLSVHNGSLSAEQPGGRLQYRYPAAQQSSNPGLKLVFEALDDFHFSTLSSAVSYREQGLLQLQIKLQGFNPAVQNGRQINLNINLEEDLPAMLASIQLASKLNDTLTQRVQQHIQQRQAAKAAGDQP